MKELGIQDILKYLPHRYPFLLVDKVINVDKENSKIITQKNVTFNEPQFTGHFPEKPIMPGVLLVEAMAQSICILALMKLEDINKKDDKKIFFLTGVDKLKIRNPVVPGDVVMFHGHILKGRQGIYKCYVEALVGEKLACSAELTAAYR